MVRISIISIFDSAPDERALEELHKLNAASTVFCCFLVDEAARMDWGAKLRERNIDFQELPVAGILDELAGHVREEYIKYVDALRAHPAFQDGSGKPVRAAHRIAMWWLHELSTHRSDAYPDYTRYLQLCLLKRYVAENNISLMVAVSGDADFLDCVKYSFPECAQQLFFSGNESRTRDPLGVRAFFQQARWGFKAAVFPVLARRMTRMKHGDRPDVVLYSQFPNLWKGSGLKTDDKYKGIVKQIQEEGHRWRFMISMLSDGHHQELSLKELVKAVADNREAFADHELLDRWSTWGDICQFALDSFRMGWLGYTVGKELARDRHKDKRGIDLTAYFMRHTRTTTARVPRVLWEGRKVARCLACVKPSSFVYYLYEWVIGRAILFNVSRLPGIRKIGVQHGPVNPRRLYCVHQPSVLNYGSDGDFIEHMPHPDEIWAEDELSRRTLLESGYPPDVVRVVDTGRKARVPGRKPHPIALRMVVYPTLWDGKSIFYSLLPFLEQRAADCVVTFKPHPRALFNADTMEHELKVRGLTHVQVHRGTMAEALAYTDMAVGTTSSALEEARESGCRVALLLLPTRYNESRLFLDPEVVKIGRADELTAYIQKEREALQREAHE